MRRQKDGTSQLDQLEQLAEELMKHRPEQGKVKSIMKKAGLPYTPDPVDQIACVLQALNGVTAYKSSTGKPDIEA